MKVPDLAENEQRVKYCIMTGGHPDEEEIRDIFRFDNLKYGLPARSV